MLGSAGLMTEQREIPAYTRRQISQDLNTLAETIPRKRASAPRKVTAKAVTDSPTSAPRAPRKPRTAASPASAPARKTPASTRSKVLKGGIAAAPEKSASAASSVKGRAKIGLPKRTSDAPSEQLKRAVLATIDAFKGREVVVLDVREKTSIMDAMIIVSGTSSRHVKSLAQEVSKAAKKLKLPPIGMEGEADGEWVIVDLGDYVVHLMLPKTREFYALERLWSPGGDATSNPLDQVS